MLFAEEGWKISVTQKSRDGGKDVIAQKEIDNQKTIAYIQAKRYKGKNKVGIKEVKEFVATVAGDKVDIGYVVTTSSFSNPAKNWLQNKGVDIATVELIDRHKLLRLMEDIASSKIPAFLKI
jgi:restriction system protein